jgi:hypothetical protein
MGGTPGLQVRLQEAGRAAASDICTTNYACTTVKATEPCFGCNSCGSQLEGVQTSVSLCIVLRCNLTSCTT